MNDDDVTELVDDLIDVTETLEKHCEHDQAGVVNKAIALIEWLEREIERHEQITRYVPMWSSVKPTVSGSYIVRSKGCETKAWVVSFDPDDLAGIDSEWFDGLEFAGPIAAKEPSDTKDGE